MTTRLALAVLVALTLVACTKELVCPRGETACGGACVALPSDPAHCGACGNVCGGATPFCSTDAGATACAAACAPGLTACGHACVAGTCKADLFAACPATSDVRPLDAALLGAGAARPVTAGLTDLLLAGSTLVSGSGYPAAGLDFLPVDPLAVPPVAHLDLVGSADVEGLALHDGLVFVSNAGVGAIDIVTASGTLLDEVPLPDQQGFPNPHGMAFVGERGYVALYGGGPGSGQAVGVLDLSGLGACELPGSVACGAGGTCGTGLHCVEGTCRPACAEVLPSIDLSAVLGAADADGVPFPSRVAAVGSRLFVTLANLKLSGPGGYYTQPAGHGKLAVIDTASANAVTIVDLGAACGNPGGLALRGSTLWVACGSFAYSTAWPGALVLVDVSGVPAVGTPLDVSAVVPNGVTFCGTHGYVPDQASGAVLRFDPASATVEAPVDVCPVQGYAYVADLTCAP